MALYGFGPWCLPGNVWSNWVFLSPLAEEYEPDDAAVAGQWGLGRPLRAAGGSFRCELGLQWGVRFLDD